MSEDNFDRFYGMPGTSEPESGESDKNLVEKLETDIIDFRHNVEIAWSKKTIYPRLKDHPEAGRFNSLGQCGATARLLEDVINEKSPGLNPQNYVGRVYDKEGKIITDNHAWVEIDLGDDSLVIDVTPDQEEGLGIDAPKIVMGLKKDLKQKGYDYQISEDDHDLAMQKSESRSFERYQVLKSRYERVRRNKDYYEELINGNIFIIAPVGAGKTELIRGLQKTIPYKAVDVGQLFRSAAYLVLNDDEEGNQVNPDLGKLKHRNIEEEDRIVGATFRKTKLLEKGLVEGTKITETPNGDTIVEVLGKDISNELYGDKINTLVPAIAKSPRVRDLVWKWINRYSENEKGVILTGHSLRDIDVTKYKVIQLEVDKEVAAHRIMERSPSEYPDISTAMTEVEYRNREDKIQETEKILKEVKSIEPIDTSNLSLEEVKFRALRKLVRRAKTIAERKANQLVIEIKRDYFSWEINPLITSIRTASKDYFQQIAHENKQFGITEFDVAIQTMIHLAGYEPDRVWKGNSAVLNDVVSLIKLGEVKEANNRFKNLIENGDIQINIQLVEEEAKRQVEKLKKIYEASSVTYKGTEIKLPYQEMGNPDMSPFKDIDKDFIQVDSKSKEIVEISETGEHMLIAHEKSTGKRIVFKRVPPEISALYQRGFHYLHDRRRDEVAAYGAYLEDNELPFATVSYSPVDRKYKQEMLHHLGIESHRILEMTRAWNAIWSPKNTMSMLFAHAHSELTREWQLKTAKRERDKPLSGIITAINGNLGFRANAFNGVGFTTIGLKPANFTYYKDSGGLLTYTPRRGLVRRLNLENTTQLQGHPNAATNKFPLLPTYEMLMLFDKKQHDRVASMPIFNIELAHYQN